MASFNSNPKWVVFIGAAGEMCRIAIERFAAATDISLVLADINVAAIEALAAKLPAGRATAQKLDLYNRPSLLAITKGASLVVLGAGPYAKTSEPVLSACLENKVRYLDFDDDVESTTAALALHEKSKAAGVPFFIGCGASPGMTNVMAVDAAKGIQKVDTIDVCWLVGDERPGIGKAVLEHLMHIAAGPCLTWANGKATVNESWVETGYAPIGHHGEMLLHETAHPEPVTLPRLFPNADRIRCLGGLHPAPFNGVARGLGVAVRSQKITLDEAVSFLLNLINNPNPLEGWEAGLGKASGYLRGGDISLKELWQAITHTAGALGPWRHAIFGMLDQIKTGECSTGDVLSFLLDSARGNIGPYCAGLTVRVTGTRNGMPVAQEKRTGVSGEGSVLFKDMAAITGGACAAFMLLALEDCSELSGVFAPEDCFEPQVFYEALCRVGVPRNELANLLEDGAEAKAHL
jgi:saccharopine dehydrogenase-like NADP-dependent oxidoreductase